MREAPDRAPLRLAGLTLAARRVGRVFADIATGAAGTNGYANYLAHHLAHHPGLRSLSREEFFRRELTARWEGVRRCC